jgi:hypothetical protein
LGKGYHFADGEPCDGELVNVERRELQVPQHGSSDRGAPDREAANRQRANRERTDRDGAERGCPYGYRMRSTTLM